MTGTIDLTGDPNIGIYTRVFEDIAVVYPGAPREFTEALERELEVEIVNTLIQGSNIIGSLVAGNSQGLVVSDLATAEEVAALEEYREVFLLGGSMNAAGNVILANDYVAAVHPDMEIDVAEEIGSFLSVPIVRLSLGGIKTVGMAGYATNKGLLVHPRANDTEIAALERVVDLPIGLGSVNMGSGLVGTGLLANSKGYIAGSATSGFELGRIEEVFGFLE
ncbi:MULTISPECIES: translation initiation factor IF-6 [unclassified Methanoculleus]|uniref:translation initiation factor IF-6 n=1 Tax=unclassified Methanoculleus TaxID=2619537 RepID=UPI0025E18A50|nr:MULTISPECIES: translation initiation factor IF-6 [unclassified Methanoculleus]MCK9318990.1 translation initiation factor IF-6 [Methanoculleus sp.]MDD2253893.1 translation initiation factor IF-6 [Methanoculleus sp.]MDD2786725.1 translation initiation factor IF-6 [Methanoculleus sp.]MDD3215574.1 translation initiation factor IF-6 [Methanoculleus sp.]MDD4314874.1 translation initiation factor IF-6 [Methanoculleus sp.]